ncbi:MAG TPA: RDD family protein [Candidatus Angelobacter sp.]|nr:RDD family protein [Candidatus Angelobacter sp.]
MQLIDLMVSPSTRVSPYAGVFDRTLAKIIDIVVLRVCLGPFDIAFGTSFLDQAHSGRIEGCIAFGLFCLYSAWLESSKHQATLGKRLVGILVENEEGKRISFPRALLRSVMQYTGIGYLLALFTERKQCLHDLIVHTQVTIGTI